MKVFEIFSHGWLEGFYDLNYLSVVVRMFMALILGGVLGMERERKRRPAGFRTYMTVCLTSALVMITAEYMLGKYNTGDPSRLGAQVISGIGFLGAGTIIINGKQVKGLTTAAGLWASACMGLTIGAGFYFGAIVSGGMIYIVMTIMRRLEIYYISNSKVVNFLAGFLTIDDLGVFISCLKKADIKVSDLEFSKQTNHEGDLEAIVCSIKLPKSEDHARVIQKLGAFQGVKYIEEIN